MITTMRLAEVLLAAGEPIEALRLLSPIENQLSEQASGQILLGRVYYQTAQLSRAQQVLENAVRLRPADDAARFLLGQVCERRGRDAEAAEHYRTAMTQRPCPEYRERLEQVLERLATTGGSVRSEDDDPGWLPHPA